MGRFDSDTAALTERAAINASRTEHDLEAWIFNHVEPRDGMHIADLGCGTGKQLFALAGRLHADTEITGVDISPEAVAEVNARAEREGLVNVRAVRASLDECPAALPSSHFDLVLSTYAIYYADDVVALLQRVAGVLSGAGQMFVCGPGVGTNQEMIALVNGCRLAAADHVPQVDDFVDSEQVAALGGHYSSVSTSRMSNTVTFTSPDQVMLWWRNHNMYRPAVDGEVSGVLEEVFATSDAFRLTKNVLGVHGGV